MSLGVILRQQIPQKISNRGNEVTQVIVLVHGTVHDSGDEWQTWSRMRDNPESSRRNGWVWVL